MVLSLSIFIDGYVLQVDDIRKCYKIDDYVPHVKSWRWWWHEKGCIGVDIVMVFPLSVLCYCLVFLLLLNLYIHGINIDVTQPVLYMAIAKSET